MYLKFFSKSIRYIFTNAKIRYLIIWYLEFRYIFPVIYSLFWLQRCATWHIYYKILLSRVRSHFWKCWINPVVIHCTCIPNSASMHGCSHLVIIEIDGKRMYTQVFRIFKMVVTIHLFTIITIVQYRLF